MYGKKWCVMGREMRWMGKEVVGGEEGDGRGRKMNEVERNRKLVGEGRVGKEEEKKKRDGKRRETEGE